MLRPLETLVTAIVRADPAARFLFAGDYINRGPDSRGVVDFLLSLKKSVHIRGNHDDGFDYMLSGKRFADHPTFKKPIDAFRAMYAYGLRETLLSYGVPSRTVIAMERMTSQEELVQIIQDHVPDEHARFFRQLPGMIETPEFFVAHGWLNPMAPTDAPDIATRLAQTPHDRLMMLWGRYSPDEILMEKRWSKPGFFGHTPVQTYPPEMRAFSGGPIQHGLVTLLDTGCAVLRDGRLTAVSVEAGHVIQAHRSGEVFDFELPDDEPEGSGLYALAD